MSDFYPLTVTDIAHDTRDAVVLTLAPRAQDAERFTFRPGQYLTFRKDFDGEELRRSYSICAGPGEGVLKVGIKRVGGGAFSSFAKSELHIGDTLDAMPPQGRFGAPKQTAGHHYLGFAAGSGITPILSIIKQILEGDAGATFTLVYGNRSASQVMFRRELGDLKDRFLNRLNVVHVFSGEQQEIELFSGRIDANKCKALFGAWVKPDKADMAFLCGPQGMMQDVSAALQEAGMAKERIKFELFGADQPGRAKLKAEEEAAARAAGDMVKATIIIDGTPHTFEMPRKGQAVLDAAREHDIDAPFSCHNGVCSTCMGRVKSGEVEMAQNYALEDYEVERGLVLTCQSYPLTDEITIEYEGH